MSLSVCFLIWKPEEMVSMFLACLEDRQDHKLQGQWQTSLEPLESDVLAWFLSSSGRSAGPGSGACPFFLQEVEM